MASGPGSTPLLDVADLGARLGGEPILQALRFEVCSGEMLGLIGPNGAGKTTLFEALAGFLPEARGALRWKGDPLPRRRWGEALFYLPDGIAPYGEHRASEVLEAFRRLGDRSRPESEALEGSLHLGPVLAKRVGELSKGNRKRLLLALAFLGRAELLLLDEPFDGLDLPQSLATMDLLRAQQEEGRTFLLSIHELRQAERLCERFLLLRAGSLIASGTLEDLRSLAGLSSGGLEEVFLVVH